MDNISSIIFPEDIGWLFMQVGAIGVANLFFLENKTCVSEKGFDISLDVNPCLSEPEYVLPLQTV